MNAMLLRCRVHVPFSAMFKEILAKAALVAALCRVPKHRTVTSVHQRRARPAVIACRQWRLSRTYWFLEHAA